MQFESWQAFWQMGGYAFYVWSAFGVCALAMLAIVVDSFLAHKRLLTALASEQARQQRIARARDGANVTPTQPD